MSRPHTPRRFGTTHTPRGDKIVLGTTVSPDGSSPPSSSIVDLHPEYWRNSGHNFRLRPNSAPTRRNIPTPPVAQIPTPPGATLVAATAGCPLSLNRVRGVVDFGRQTPRSPRVNIDNRQMRNDGVTGHPANRNDAQNLPDDPFMQAAGQISPRTRGFVMSAGSARDRPGSAQMSTPRCNSSEQKTAPPTSPHPPRGFRMSTMTSRTQANFAAGIGEPPTAAYYRAKLADSGAPRSAILSNDDAEGYLQTFVDQEDNQFTVGLRGATERRAKLIVRKRTYPVASTYAAMPNDQHRPHCLEFKKMIGRAAPPCRPASLRNGDSGGSSPRAEAAAADSIKKHVRGLTMSRTTGRSAPVSTVLPTPPVSAGPSGGEVALVAADKRHVPGIDIGKLRPHDLALSPRARFAPSAQAYHVRDGLVYRKAPSAVIA